MQMMKDKRLKSFRLYRRFNEKTNFFEKWQHDKKYKKKSNKNSVHLTKTTKKNRKKACVLCSTIHYSKLNIKKKVKIKKKCLSLLFFF